VNIVQTSITVDTGYCEPGCSLMLIVGICFNCSLQLNACCFLLLKVQFMFVFQLN
jgi:hypothetical protein